MKTDLKREIDSYAARCGQFSVLVVPDLQFLMIDGRGDPNTSAAYQEALGSLYPLAYGLKFLSKRDLGRDYTVMPLEGLWWADDLASFTGARDKSHWQWTLMNLVPDWISHDHLDSVRRAAARRKGPTALDAVRLERFDEGLSVQTLHVGAYDNEGPVLDTMHHEFLPARGLRPTGKHHEVYLSDARRTAPDKLRTILRQPVTTLPI